MSPTTPIKAISGRLASADAWLDELVDATKDARDRYVDFLRAFAICVVVVWHWVLSVTHWDGGELVMPNPIEHIPMGWAPTWLLQVMPLFFFVGGYANLAAWQAVRRDGGGAREYYRKRLWRLLPAPAVFAAVWLAGEAAAQVAVPGYRSVTEWGGIVLVPLWFLAAYLWVVALVPVTAELHRRRPVVAVVGLGVLVALVDAGRFGFDAPGFGWVNTALVWVFVHQLGYLYRDGTFTEAGTRARWTLAGAGLAALALITGLEPYPRSMVAVEAAEVSHMYPTTVGIAALAVFQAGVALLLRPSVSAWLRRRRVWKTVVAINAVIMTVFLWHMTALVAVIGVWGALGGELLAEPTAGWWLQRPLWLLLPALALAPLVALFSRFETGGLRR